MTLIFEWDSLKAEANLRKHGVSFETAAQVFADPFHLSVQDRIEQAEARWQTIGLVGGYYLLLVAHSWIEDDEVERVRIISARAATRAERRRYEEG